MPTAHNRIVALVYDAATGAGPWTDALQALQSLFSGCAAAFFLWNRDEDAIGVSATSGNITGEAVELYKKDYFALDPHFPLLADQPVGEILASQDHFDDQYVRRSAYFSEFLIPHGRRYWLLARAFSENGRSSVLGVSRGPAQPPFAAGEMRQLRDLLPHVCNAARLHNVLHRRSIATLAGLSVIEHLQDAALVVDAAGRVVWMNDLAERFFAADEKLLLRNQILVAERSAENAPLVAAIVSAVGDRREGARLILGKCLGGMPLVVRIAPLTLSSPILIGIDAAPLVLILIRDTERRADALAARATELFGLTPAEERLAIGLLRGRTVAEIAVDARVSVATIRTQLSLTESQDP